MGRVGLYLGEHRLCISLVREGVCRSYGAGINHDLKLGRAPSSVFVTAFVEPLVTHIARVLVQRACTENSIFSLWIRLATPLLRESLPHTYQKEDPRLSCS